MKTLYLLRHAKSSWDNAELDDFDRPLAPRGDRAARLVGAYMEKLRLIPDFVLCSPAERCRQTWALVSSYIDRDPGLQTPEGLYLAGSAQMLDMIHGAPFEAASLMLVGHNPGMGALTQHLATEGDPRDLAVIAEKYPTGGLAEIQCDYHSWSEVEGGRLVRFVRPRDLE